jgi:bacteriorhodopsin
MVVSSFAFIGLSAKKHRSQRLFHYMTAAITLVASIAYFSMGSNLGWTAIQVEFPRSDPVVSGLMRQIFYVRVSSYCPRVPSLPPQIFLTFASESSTSTGLSQRPSYSPTYS